MLKNNKLQKVEVQKEKLPSNNIHVEKQQTPKSGGPKKNFGQER